MTEKQRGGKISQPGPPTTSTEALRAQHKTIRLVDSTGTCSQGTVTMVHPSWFWKACPESVMLSTMPQPMQEAQGKPITLRHQTRANFLSHPFLCHLPEFSLRTHCSWA